MASVKCSFISFCEELNCTRLCWGINRVLQYFIQYLCIFIIYSFSKLFQTLKHSLFYILTTQLEHTFLYFSSFQSLPFTAPVIILWLLDAAMQSALLGGWVLWSVDPKGVGVVLHPWSCMGNGGRWKLLNPGCVMMAALWMGYLFNTAVCLNIRVTRDILETHCVRTL